MELPADAEDAIGETMVRCFRVWQSEALHKQMVTLARKFEIKDGGDDIAGGFSWLFFFLFGWLVVWLSSCFLVWLFICLVVCFFGLIMFVGLLL